MVTDHQSTELDTIIPVVFLFDLPIIRMEKRLGIIVAHSFNGNFFRPVYRFYKGLF
jgi:hypothetical protein